MKSHLRIFDRPFLLLAILLPPVIWMTHGVAQYLNSETATLAERVFVFSGPDLLVRGGLGLVAIAICLMADIYHRRLLVARSRIDVNDDEFRDLVEGSIQGIAIHQDGRMVYVNQALADLLDYSVSEMLGADALDFVADDDTDRVARYGVLRRSGGDAPGVYEFKARRKNGDGVAVLAQARLMDWKGTTATQLILVDISERVAVETALAESEKKYRDLVEGSLQGTIIHIGGKIVFANETVSRMLGYEPDQIIDLDVVNVIAPVDRERLGKYAVDRLAGKAAPTIYECQGRKKDGTEISLLMGTRVVSWDGKAALQNSVVDISDRVKATKELEESERKFRDLIDGSIQGIVIHQDGKLVYANVAAARMHGYGSYEELIGLNIGDFIAPRDRGRLVQNARDRLAGGPVPDVYEYQGLCQDGSRIPLLLNNRIITWEGKPAIQNVLTDLTRQREAEDMATRFGRIVENLGEEVYVFDAATLKFIQVNRGGRENLGYTMEEFLELTPVALGGPITLKEFEDRLKPLRDGSEDFIRFRSFNRRKDGTEYPCDVRLEYSELETRPVFVAIVQDVTDKLAMETRLQQISAEQEVTLETARIGINFVRQRRIIWANTFFKELFGWEGDVDLGASIDRHLVNPEILPNIRKEADAAMRKGQAYRFEALMRHNDGTQFLASLLGSAVDPGDPLEGAIWLIEDITERRETEAALRKQAMIMDQIDTAVISLDADSHIVGWNRAAEHMFGYSAEEAMGQSALMLYFEEDRESRQERVYEPLMERGHLEIEVRFRKKSGEEFFALVGFVLWRDEDDNVVGIIAHGTDITERRRAEQAMRFQAQLIGQINDAVLSADLDGTVTSWNAAAQDLFGYAPEEIIGRPYSVLLPDYVEQVPDFQVNEILEKEHKFEQQRECMKKSGETFIGRISLSILRDAEGKQEGTIAYITDITAQLRADEAVRVQGQIIDQIHDAVIAIGLDGRITAWNSGAERLYQYKASEMLGADGDISYAYQEGARKEGTIKEALDQLREQDHIFVEGRRRKKSGEIFDADVHLSALRDVKGNFTGGISFTLDVTERKKAEQALRESQKRFQELAALSPVGVFYADLDGSVSYVNEKYCHMCGLTTEQVLGNGWVKSLHPEDRDKLLEDWQELVENFRDRIFEYRFVTPEGKVTWVIAQVAQQRNDSGETVGYVGAVTDITERRRAEELLKKAHDELEVRVEERTLKLRQQITERKYAEQSLRESQAKLKRINDELEQRVANRTEELNRELSERKRTEAELRKSQRELIRQANYDDLTGLPNRVLGFDRLSRSLARANRQGRTVAVMYVDLDRFKNVNDTLGHTTGDQLLKEASDRLTSSIRESDTVARLGGDEFLIILPDLAADVHLEIIARKIMEAFSAPFELDRQEIFVTSSIGIAIYPTDGVDPETLLQSSDSAMYQAKEEGRNTYRFFTAAMNEAAVQRVEMESKLRYALQRDELEVYYQPIMDVADGGLVGAEALLRWVHPERGMIGADQFIPLAEETGLIVAFGEWVLDKACHQIMAWRNQGWSDLVLAVNVSSRQFRRGDLMANVSAALASSGLPPPCLELEITESLLMESGPEVTRILNDLSELGVRLSIDDFGTGYSALSYLKNYHFDTLKIDRAFVRDVTTDQEAAALARAIVAMAHSLDMIVIGEGVETEDQLKFLRAESCNLAQGFLFSKPVNPSEFEKNIDSWMSAKKT